MTATREQFAPTRLRDGELSDVPETAFRAPVGRVQFAAGDNASEAAITVTARTGDVINHWYWGRIVHDLAGMRLAGDRIAFDWCHYDWLGAIGYGDKFDVAGGDLVISGMLIADGSDDDRAAEIILKGRRGVPYEASIYFDPDNGLKMEWLPERMTAAVNGREIVGPCVIVREWLLRGVGICLYGADPNTSTEFAGRKDRKLTVHFGGQRVSKENQPTELTEKPANDPAVDPRAEFAAALSRFTAAFGAEYGAKWAAEGKTFEAACELHIAELSAKLAERDIRIAELSAKLAAVDVGAAEPVTFSSGEPKDKPGTPPASKFSHLGDGLAKFASAIKLPRK
jgi:hypothetical protein